MPTYEYICEGCGERFDYFQPMTSPALENHPDCLKGDSNVKRIVSGGSGLIFKGSGFYLTDYKNKKEISENSKDSKSEKNSKKNKKPVKETKKGKLKNE